MEGQPYQLFINLPFGELMAEQTGTGYQSPYKFNGKLQRSENPDASGELDPETGLYYYGARYYDPHSSTWLSVDPLAEKYAGWTPYNYCVGNPVVFVDPDGRNAIVIITGEASEQVVKQIDAGAPNLKVRRDKDGKLIADGKPVTDNEIKLYNAITDPNVIINVTANNHNRVEKGVEHHGGAFMGNKFAELETTITLQTNNKPYTTEEYNYTNKIVITQQLINPNETELFDAHANTPGQTALHEITESYSGGLISLRAGIEAPRANSVGPGDWIADQAHRASTTVKQPGKKIYKEDLMIQRIRKK